jgi:hypothetical protein
MSEPDATAIVALLPTDQGGRAGATPNEWFRCVFSMGERNFDVRLGLDEPLRPGSARRVNVYFLDPEPALATFRPGTAFSVREGGEIGLGRIERARNAGPLAAE